MADAFSGARGRSRSAFTGATPKSVRLANGDPSTLSQINAIETRTNQVKRKVRNHFGKYVETWVVAEAVKLWTQRAGLSKETAPREELAKQVTKTGIMAEARRNVHARLTNRLTKVNFIKTRLSNAAVRNMQVMAPMRARGVAQTQKGPSKGSPSR